MKVSPIDRIPYKVELHIFSYCDASELFACCHVRRRWHALLSRDDFWSSLSLVNSNRASAHTAYYLRDEQQSAHRGKRTGTAIVESIKTSGHGHRGGDTSGGGDGFVVNEGHTDDYYSYWNTNSNSSSQSRRASASSSPQFTIRVSCPPSRAMEYTMRLLRHICFLPSFTCGDARSLLRMKRSGGDDDYRKQRRQWGNASSSSEDEEDSSDASCSSDRRNEKEGDADVGSFFSSANRYAICSVDPNGWTTSLLGGLRVSPSQYAETTMSTISIYFRISMLHGSSGVDGDDDHDNNSYQANTMWSMVTEESPSASASRSQRQGKAECIFGVVDATHASAYLQRRRISNDADAEALLYNQRSYNNYSHHSSNVKQRAVEVVDEVDQLVSDWFSATVASIEAESRGGDGNNNNNSNSDRGHPAPLRMAPAARTSAFVSYADEDGIGGGGGGVHVGDSVYSYGFTSRGDLLHNGTSSSLSSTPLREGDVVGIHFKLHEDVVSVTHNRDAVGVIATDAFSDGQSWMPAVSCRGPCIVSLMPPYLRASNF